MDINNYIRDSYLEMTDIQMATACGITESAVRGRRRRMGLGKPARIANDLPPPKPRRRSDKVGRTHLVIPDTQIKVGVPTIQLEWIGRYIAEKQPDVVIHLGDHWDMPSLSSYDKGKKSFEGRRYRQDVEAGNKAFALLDRYISRIKGYHPRKVFLFGNHEERIVRAVEEDAMLDGTIGLQDLNTLSWERHNFLEVVWIDGVAYSHYFYNPMSGRPYGGQAITRLKTIGHTYTMGHQQTLDYAIRFVGGKSHHGLVAGACYLHDEEYKGPQGNAHWRGIIVKHAVLDGSYNPMFVDLDYLCRRYEGVSLEEYSKRL